MQGEFKHINRYITLDGDENASLKDKFCLLGPSKNRMGIIVEHSEYQYSVRVYTLPNFEVICDVFPPRDLNFTSYADKIAGGLLLSKRKNMPPTFLYWNHDGDTT